MTFPKAALKARRRVGAIRKNGQAMISSPSLVEAHPRLSGVEVWRGPRTGSSHVIVGPRSFTPAELVDLGEWLTEQGREHERPSGCLST